MLDPVFLSAVTASATTLYQVLNAPYHQWSERFPPMQQAVVVAARAAGARLVSFENVYMYGAPSSEPFSENAPNHPCSSKGEIRARMADELTHLRSAGVLEVVQVRASDLFGPGVEASALGEQVFARALAGRRPRLLGDLDAPHTWTFVDDAGKTLATLGTMNGALPDVVHVPSAPPRSSRQVIDDLAGLLSRPLRPQTTPAWLLRLVGWFDPTVGALTEMLYEFESPFVVADGVARELGLSETPFDAALAATVASFRSPHGGDT